MENTFESLLDEEMNNKVDDKKEESRNVKGKKELMQAIIENSIADTWKEAVKEWTIIALEEDARRVHRCICGQEGLRYLFTIYNQNTDTKLFPIGSSCIKKFNRIDLDTQVESRMQIWRINQARQYDKNAFDDIQSGLYSRKSIRELCEKAHIDRDSTDFLLKMFGKRKEITPNQAKKIAYHMNHQIAPYLEKEIGNTPAPKNMMSYATKRKTVQPDDTEAKETNLFNIDIESEKKTKDYFQLQAKRIKSAKEKAHEDNLLINNRQIKNLPDKQPCIIYSTIIKIIPQKTRYGNDMVSLILKDEESTVKGVLFPKIYNQYKDNIKKGRIVKLTGRVEHSSFGDSIICETIEDLPE